MQARADTGRLLQMSVTAQLSLNILSSDTCEFLLPASSGQRPILRVSICGTEVVALQHCGMLTRNKQHGGIFCVAELKSGQISQTSHVRDSPALAKCIMW